MTRTADATSRSGRPRKRLLALVRAREPLCHLCGQQVWTWVCAQTHPLGSTVDEIIPVSKGGSTLDPDNCRHACRCCNTSRNNRPLTPEVYAKCRAISAKYRAQYAKGPGTTSRTW